MKERKLHIRSNRYIQTITRRDQDVISRLRTGYCRATHAAIMNREPRPECPFCEVPLTIDHILWQCKKNQRGHDKNEHHNESLEGGRSGLYNGI
jgi:hypothetical protein